MIDGVRVQLTSAEVGKVPLDDFQTRTASVENLLIVGVRIDTQHQDRKYLYKSWRRDLISGVSATDEFGNRYLRSDFRPGVKVVGGTDEGSVYEDGAITDVLVFERPVANAQRIDLDLPGKNLGVSGTFRFRIALAPSTPPAPPPAPTPVLSEKPDPKSEKPATPDQPTGEASADEAPRGTAKPGTMPPNFSPATPKQAMAATKAITPGKRPVPMAVGPRQYKQYTDAKEAGRDADAKYLVDQGQVVMVDKPLEVTVETTFQGLAYVRPTEGKYAGKFFVVDASFVK